MVALPSPALVETHLPVIRSCALHGCKLSLLPGEAMVAGES
jgi:hypothetical protein